MKSIALSRPPLCLSLMLIGSQLSLATQTGTGGGEILTNDKVITMTTAGLPASIIVNKIRSSKTNFDTSTDELIRLKKARVSDDIINAMVEASSHASTVTAAMGA